MTPMHFVILIAAAIGSYATYRNCRRWAAAGRTVNPSALWRPMTMIEVACLALVAAAFYIAQRPLSPEMYAVVVIGSALGAVNILIGAFGREAGRRARVSRGN
jgi:hypothetical protein